MSIKRVLDSAKYWAIAVISSGSCLVWGQDSSVGSIAGIPAQPKVQVIGSGVNSVDPVLKYDETTASASPSRIEWSLSDATSPQAVALENRLSTPAAMAVTDADAQPPLPVERTSGLTLVNPQQFLVGSGGARSVPVALSTQNSQGPVQSTPAGFRFEPIQKYRAAGRIQDEMVAPRSAAGSNLGNALQTDLFRKAVQVNSVSSATRTALFAQQPGTELQYSPFVQYQTSMPWVSPDVCWQPLYFEQANLERYGNHHALIQPAVSGAHFFASTVFLPYKIASESPYCCRSGLGYDRPGNCVPAYRQRIDLNARGLVGQGLVTTGLIFGL